MDSGAKRRFVGLPPLIRRSGGLFYGTDYEFRTQSRRVSSPVWFTGGVAEPLATKAKAQKRVLLVVAPFCSWESSQHDLPVDTANDRLDAYPTSKKRQAYAASSANVAFFPG